MAVKMLMFVCGVVIPCELVGRYIHFGGTYCHHLQDSMTMEAEWYVASTY
jgi:hypothetical protein